MSQERGFVVPRQSGLGFGLRSNISGREIEHQKSSWECYLMSMANMDKVIDCELDGPGMVLTSFFFAKKEKMANYSQLNYLLPMHYGHDNSKILSEIAYR